MWYLKSIAFISLVLLTLTISGFAQTQPDAPEILKKVGETYRNLQSYYLEYATIRESKTEGNGMKSISRWEEAVIVSAAKPDRWRIEAKSVTSSVVALSDGHATWIYAPGRHQAIHQEGRCSCKCRH